MARVVKTLFVFAIVLAIGLNFNLPALAAGALDSSKHQVRTVNVPPQTKDLCEQLGLDKLAWPLNKLMCSIIKYFNDNILAAYMQILCQLAGGALAPNYGENIKAYYNINEGKCNIVDE